MFAGRGTRGPGGDPRPDPMKRIATAFVLIPLVSYVALWGPGWLFLAVTTAVALLCFHEYTGIVAGHGIERPGPAAYAAGALVLLVPAGESLVVLLAMLFLVLALRATDVRRGLPAAAAAVLGMVYIFGTWRAGVALRMANPYWLFFVLALNWIGDTAAYYVGGAVGRHKLAPALSPKKSWEGSAASLVASLAFGYFYLKWLIPAISPTEGLLISAAANVAGQLGDLVESMMKRGAGIKDSGRLLPGHGGWLDRVDSTLFSMPTVYWLLTLSGRQ